jgi:hypothetical protein
MTDAGSMTLSSRLRAAVAAIARGPHASSLRSRAPGILIIVATLCAGLAFLAYPGTAGPFWIFHGAFMLFAWLAFRPPYRYGVIALAAFLILGHWIKLMVHLLTGVPFIEPVGAFDGSGAVWDRALGLIAAALLGAAVARALDLWWRPVAVPVRPSVPDLFVRHRRLVWTATWLAFGALVVWNLFGAFLMIGVNTRQLLPLRLHIALACWLLFGSGVWMALLLTWERARRGPLHPGWMLVPAAEGLVASASMLSRSVYIFRLIPYLLLLLTRRDVIRRPSLPQAGAGAALLGVGLAASLAASIVTRAIAYPPVKMPATHSASASGHEQDDAGRPSTEMGGAKTDPRTGQGTSGSAGAAGSRTGRGTKSAEQRQQAYRSQWIQFPSLFLARWIGLEGVLVFSSSAERGWPLFGAVLRESPALGVDTHYQRLSNATYTKLQGFTFLTLAGVIGILSSSGTLLGAGAGLFAIVAILILLDELALRATGSVLVASSIGVSAANIVAQMNFPYNTAIIGIEMAVLLLGLGMVLRWLPPWTQTAREPDEGDGARSSWSQASS